MTRRTRILALSAAVLLLAVGAFAQRGRRGGGGGFGGGFGGFGEGPSSDPIPVREADFHFIRVQYVDRPGMGAGFRFASRNGQGRGWWMQDWPDAENHFTVGIQRLTRIDIGDPRYVALSDPKLFDYPWIYLTQAANWEISSKDAENLREYLMRGGFLVTDDFWGENEWELFRETMDRVLPGRPIDDIPESDAVMHAMYEIRTQDRTFIPGSRHLSVGPGGSTRINQPAGTEPAWRAIMDDKKRIIVAANFNTDTGDAWEFADVPYYPAEMTLLAYRYGINYIVYAMTH
jgi:Domain of unknown function (DUF4159)